MATARRTVIAGAVALALTGCSRTTRAAPASTSPTITRPSAPPGSVEVTGAIPLERRRAYRSHVTTAMREVTSLWHTDWRTVGVRLVVATSGEEFARLTGRPANGTVPAVTTAAGVVVVHPALWTSTSADGRQVVITHELTHVALGQGRLTGVPLWVIEGSAEVTAYRSTGLSPRQVAPSLFRAVASGELPTGPPPDDEVRSTDGSPTLAYQKAWAWCSFLAQRRGLEVFTAFVRRADAREPGAFRAAYGVEPNGLTAAYRTWLRAQA
ncbi:hypothetical protein [Luteipulveratus halotolerans]|uniref:hypothetical protein n=1 Tax=Luteipulveratus halotolerans TaxID=1631356 RepID=UPI0006822FAB|nr:hypothetical protein [Luteipulveratus halotolerans]